MPRNGHVNLITGGQQLTFHQAYAGRTLTVRAGLRTLPATAEGELARSIGSWLTEQQPR